MHILILFNAFYVLGTFYDSNDWFKIESEFAKPMFDKMPKMWWKCEIPCIQINNMHKNARLPILPAHIYALHPSVKQHLLQSPLARFW